MTRDLHSALRTERVAEAIGAGVNFLLVRLQRGKNDIGYSVHAYPQRHTLSGLQTPDFLVYLGFAVSTCAFTPGGRCLIREVTDGFHVGEFARAFEQGWGAFEKAEKDFEACGFFIKQPVGLMLSGLDRGSGPVQRPAFHARGDGHTSPESIKLKQSDDDVFKCVISWVAGGADKGWTLHYGPKHAPLSPEIEAALAFLGGFHGFRECPEFDFEPCRWRFFPHIAEEGGWNRSAEYVHGFFDAHASRFSPAIQSLLTAHATLLPFGMNLLPPHPVGAVGASKSIAPTPPVECRPVRRSVSGYKYDVALSFAGMERPLASDLAKKLLAAGVEVFYDQFYPEHLWGKDLAAHFDRVYRKESRFCVIFVSEEYAKRAWTYHELRSALARAVSERGQEYILPIQVERIDLDGIPPTLGYLSLAEYPIDTIAELLLRKLKGGA